MLDYEKIGVYITEQRKQKDITQQEFADILGVTHQAVSKWENGKTIPDTETLVSMAKYFHVKVDDLLRADSEKPQIKLEFGSGILPYVDVKQKDNLLVRIKELRARINSETVNELPLIQVCDNEQLGALQYRITVNDNILLNHELDQVPPEDRLSEMMHYLEFVIKGDVIR